MNAFNKWALIVFGVVVALLLLTKLPGARATSSISVPMKTFQEWLDDVRKLQTTTEQDNNPLLALIHSTNALSKLSVLQNLDLIHHLAQRLDVDLEALRVKLLDMQSEAIAHVGNACPDLRLAHDVEWT